MTYTVEQIARVCHQTNKAFCEANGDFSQPDWEASFEWQRDSARAGVQFHFANPNADSAASHNEWMRHKLADGWVHGDIKDPEAKTHPCLVEFNELPLHQQIKDTLFRSIIHIMNQTTHDVVEIEDVSKSEDVIGVAQSDILQHVPETNESLTLANFNPSGLSTVDDIKAKADLLDDLIRSEVPDNDQRKRALDSLEVAAMLAVKANFV